MEISTWEDFVYWIEENKINFTDCGCDKYEIEADELTQEQIETIENIETPFLLVDKFNGFYQIENAE